MARFKNILVPVDFTDKNTPAIEIALDLAAASGGQVTLVHVIEKIALDTDLELAEFYAKLGTRAQAALDSLTRPFTSAGVFANQKIRYGKRLAEIVGEAAEGRFDLIVMASHRPDVQHPLQTWATLSYQVSALCPSPVLLVK